jgi:hypothetical protein
MRNVTANFKKKKHTHRMKKLTLLFFWILTISIYGQNFEKGIYRGQKLPFEICFFTYTDSLLEVEYFYEKADKVFGHIPPKTLILGMESFATKPAYKSSDDSIKVYFKKDYFLIERLGFGDVKVYNLKDTKQKIVTYRNRNLLFSFSQELHEKLKTKSGFDEKQFWEKFNSFELEKYTAIDSQAFIEKINEVNNEMNKNWR